jgi:serine kinase of HPr protein (carbohydrate metabolism regulator)
MAEAALPPTIHASAVLVGSRAVLVRGPSGSGKSRLVLSLIEAVESGILPFARLVADDRVHVTAVNGRLIARAPDSLAGQIELRGLGILRLPFEAMAVLGLVIDLGVEQAERMPAAGSGVTVIEGLALPRIDVEREADAMRLTVAALKRYALSPPALPAPT